MIAKAPEAPRNATKRSKESMLKVSKQVIDTFGADYDLAKKMTKGAYADFLANLEQDYGGLLSDNGLMEKTGEAAAKLQRAVQTTEPGSKAIKDAEKVLSDKLDTALKTMRNEQGKPLSDKEKLATKMLVTKAMTDTPEAQEKAPRRDDMAMGKAQRQFKEPKGRNEAPAYEEVDPGDSPLPPSDLPPRGRQQPPQGRSTKSVRK